jgi:hypothetical protein
MTEEKKKEQTSAKTDVTLAEKKAAKKAAKKRKKFEKKELKRLKKEHERRAAILPAAKRPIICPPDCSDSSNKHVIFGMILRVFVLFIAVAGLTMFVTEAFGFDMTPEYLASKDVREYAGVAAGADFGYVAMWSALFVALFALMALVIMPLFFFVGFSGSIYLSGRLISHALSKHDSNLEPEPNDIK